MRDWELFLQQPLDCTADAPNCAKPILRFISRRIDRQFELVVQDGEQILADPAAPDEMLHELRIECKKLRYLMELFSDLFPPDKINQLIKQLRSLQNNLGEFNDLSIQEEYLLRTADEMAAVGIQSPQTLLSIGALVAALDARRNSVRADFADTFRSFATDETRREFRDLFHRPSKRRRAKPAAGVTKQGVTP